MAEHYSEDTWNQLLPNTNSYDEIALSTLGIFVITALFFTGMIGFGWVLVVQPFSRIATACFAMLFSVSCFLLGFVSAIALEK